MIKFYPFNPTDPTQSLKSALSTFKRHYGTPRRIVIDRCYLRDVKGIVEGATIEGGELGLKEIQIEG